MRLAEVVQTPPGGGFLDHAVAVTELRDRRSLFLERCRGRAVLHVGCADVPVFDADTNLHVALARETDRLDGLDVSEEGLAVLRRHVAGDYFTSKAEIDRLGREYDLVLAPEVIEHVRDPHAFLTEIFGVRARQYLVTAPHLAWFREMRTENGVFHERVHPDHKAWYSPYTLLATLRPFIDEACDDVEVFVLGDGASVGVAVTKPYEPRTRAAPAASAPSESAASDAPRTSEGALADAKTLLARGDSAGAIQLLADARARAETRDARPLFEAHARVLLSIGQNMETLRQGLAWLKAHPDEAGALEICAEAAEALGQHEHARKWRAAAHAKR